MKKIATLSVCLIIAASFVSCGDSDKKSGKSSTNGSDKAARDYVDAIYSKKGGEKSYTLIFPDEYIEKLKDSEGWEDIINNRNDEIGDILREYKVNVNQVEKVKELDDLKLAESYFIGHHYIDSIDVTKGYEYTAEIQMTDRDDGEKEATTENFCVVKADGDWKVIPASAEYLEEKYTD